MSDADRVGTGKQATKRASHAHTDRVAAWLPRAMRADQAAAYLSMSKSMFLKLVGEKVMPESIKIRGMTMWDRLELDTAFDDLKNPDPESGNTMHKILGIKP